MQNPRPSFFRRNFQFAIKHYKRELKIGLLVLFVTIVIVFLSWSLGESFSNFYSAYIDTVISISTLVVGIGLWFAYLDKRRTESLSKKLTVHFKYDKKYIMSCFEAYLSSEADIRQWAQQIGAQISKERQLSFYPYITSLEPKENPANKENNIHSFMHYEITIYLRELPTTNPLLEKHYVFWIQDDVSLGYKQGSLDEHPTEPLSKEQAYNHIKKHGEVETPPILKLVDILEKKNALLKRNNPKDNTVNDELQTYYRIIDNPELTKLKDEITKLTKEYQDSLNDQIQQQSN
ncbi:hypothetical protein [Parafilimonas terrae]|uniref:Uncharacterized protein n=1 Tax=Parafilimonas terrae TaxID=1465490 RepID=A0A1I5TJE5_9BACT|nr:hypothetical protein [Parafilimonas terrae]SFP83078.1 hypothetical protein SAMN05444277_102160 [Parafilimonas terrae]